MRDFVPLRRTFEKLVFHFSLDHDNEFFVKSHIFEDNNGYISIYNAPKLSPCTKYIAIKYHFVQNFFGSDSRNHGFHPFIFMKINTEEQKTNISLRDSLKKNLLLFGIFFMVSNSFLDN